MTKTKTKRHVMKKNNKTRKNKITFIEKNHFIQEILKEWVKQTHGHYKRDISSPYEDDYYLSFTKYHDYFNHIHVVLKKFKQNHNLHNNILYVMKKYDLKKEKVDHSKEIKINIFSDPAKIVHNMIKNYADFNQT
jgi:hypothetical protein